MVLMSINNISIEESSGVLGSRLGLFGSQLKIDEGSRVSTNGMGC